MKLGRNITAVQTSQLLLSACRSLSRPGVRARARTHTNLVFQKRGESELGDLIRSQVAKMREEKTKESKFLIRPGSHFRILWDVATMCLLFYLAIAMPVQLSFDIEAPMSVRFRFGFRPARFGLAAGFRN